jgi:hypothetical protein
MKLQNVTMVVLVRTANGGLKVGRVIENPVVAVDPATKKPVIGPLARRLMTVGEIAKNKGISRNKAADERRNNPLLYAVAFADQEAGKVAA